ncbi:hypothetical protein AAIH25_00465 [Arthrobacter crystallopoietes]|jgi:hypothetical protein|uniref:hypothetical protein n=1 Tax=Micrococcaceae TaxID=1268 RepID=UPI0021CA0C27|nr:hypothetical protein [Arthrobacter sp. Marseille-P9274]
MQQQTRPRPTDEQLKTSSLYLRIVLLLMLATLLASSLPLPWKAAAAAIALVTAVVSIVGLVKVVRAGLPGTFRITFVLGLIAAGFFLLTSLAQIVFWPVTADFEACTSAAVTQSAQEACTKDYSDRLMQYNKMFNPQD